MRQNLNPQGTPIPRLCGRAMGWILCSYEKCACEISRVHWISCSCVILIIVYLQSYNSMFSILNAYHVYGKPSTLIFPWHLYASVTWITITYENDLLPARHQAIVILKCWCVHKPITEHMLEISHNWIYSELYCLWWHHHLGERKAVLYYRKEI